MNLQQNDSFNALGGFGIILASIFWREAWKYGERDDYLCWIDDQMHALIGFKNNNWQSLYHLTLR